MENQEPKKYVDLLGEDFTEWMTSPEQIELFNQMVEAQKKTVGVPFKDCYREVADALNIEAQIKGRPPRVRIQAGPGLN